ncbi:preprotein translocase subunit SecA [Candidatus Dojkabacteria bacterium]|nr:preprotein translocase subunit SecA [Candidatus Dojkabacteria bacterium]
MFKFLSNLFDSNEKQLNKYRPLVEKINELDSSVSKLSDEELSQKTKELREKLDIDLEKARDIRDPFLPVLTKADIEGDTQDVKRKLDEVLVEAYAYVKEAAKRKTLHKPFDVQVLGGIFLANGFVTELFTGEGKTLVATMPLFLYGLFGKSAHLVTVNDYLAKRDGEWSGHIYNALGMSLGIITPGASYKFVSDEEILKIKPEEAQKGIAERKKIIEKNGRLLMSSMNGLNLVSCTKKEAYDCDIVYGTNNEFGFDYLRDNMSKSLEQRVQSPLFYSIVDECDSILIDEARTPLIISSPAADTNELYQKFASIVNNLKDVDDYVIDEKSHAVNLTEKGVDKVEKLLGIENIWENYAYVHHLDNALKAKELYKKDDKYIIKEGQILIVDEFTGRVLEGRRYSEGLHQAIEAKENVPIKKESRTLATITFQNYFRLYDFLAGMTGTALTEAEEFADIYDLEVIVVPTDKPVIRKDLPDFVFRTQAGKFNAVVEEIKELYESGRPVLVGTTSVEKSELLSSMLKKDGIPHNVLNAKQHQKEAMIVSQAGQKGQITIATNMAGRGTDIALGSGVKDLGGLHIIGTERHESRRIDNQLRGRSGRLGDPGSSRFYVSFQDDLMRLFGGDSVTNLLGNTKIEDDIPLELGIVGRSIESAQRKVESYNFDIRKHLVEYDDVLNQQREIIYDWRRKILTIVAKNVVDNEREKDVPEFGKREIDYDFSVLDREFAQNVYDQLMNFSLNNPDTWTVSFESEDNEEVLTKPLRLWILKISLSQVDFVLSSQLKDDAKIDDLEERNILQGFLDIVPHDLADFASRKIGYKGWDDFSAKFYEGEDIQSRKMELVRVIISAYICHIISLKDVVISNVEKLLILQTIDNLWVEHLDLMTDLRQGITLRQYAHKDPLVEYKNEGFNMFDKMLNQIEDNIVKRFYKVRLVKKTPEPEVSKVAALHEAPKQSLIRGGDNRPGANVSKIKTIKKSASVGRNDPCPCGSGKKYKKCCYPQYGK